MTLEEFKVSFEQEARNVGDYQHMDKKALADLYVQAEDANDERARSQIFAAFMLLYFNKIYKWKVNSKSLFLQDEDFVDWLYHAINYGLSHRQWLNADKDISQDKNAVDKIINRCCETTRLIKYQEANKFKRKINTQTYSLETLLEDCGDEVIKGEAVVDVNNNIKDLITQFCNKGWWISALMLDDIITSDKFNSTSVISSIKKLDAYGIMQFKKQYQVTDFEENKILEDIAKCNNRKLHKILSNTLEEIKENKEMLQCLWEDRIYD